MDAGIVAMVTETKLGLGTGVVVVGVPWDEGLDLITELEVATLEASTLEAATMEVAVLEAAVLEAAVLEAAELEVDGGLELEIGTKVEDVTGGGDLVVVVGVGVEVGVVVEAVVLRMEMD